MKTNLLTLSWGVSRGQYTEGYAICRLDDGVSHQRFTCNGGGYDMQGTVFADWLKNTYQDRLRALCSSLHPNEVKATYYGMNMNPETGKVRLDGGCGLEAMLKVAAGIGLTVQRYSDRRGHLQSLLILDEHPDAVGKPL